jgi:hypothetical protein
LLSFRRTKFQYCFCFPLLFLLYFRLLFPSLPLVLSVFLPSLFPLFLYISLCLSSFYSYFFKPQGSLSLQTLTYD